MAQRLQKPTRRVRGELFGDVTAQFRLFNLADVGHRQFADYLDSFGPFELRDTASGKKLAHRGKRESLSISQRQKCARPLAENRIGHRHHGGGADRRMRDEVRFDFLGVDLFAAAVDQVFDSSLDDETPGRIEPHQVAGAIESIVGERFAIALGRTVVAANRVRSATP